MRHAENDYIRAGFAYEKGKLAAESLRRMIESEMIPLRADARRLIEQGRAEARLSNTTNRKG